MGVVKGHLDQTPVDPELARAIRLEISERVAELAGLSLEVALAVFDRSFLVNAAATRPWPILHETADYWARLLLEKEGHQISAEV